MVKREFIPDIENDEYNSREWHSSYIGSYKFKIEKSYLEFKLNTVKSGCGSVLLSEYRTRYGETDISPYIDSIEELLEDLKEDGIGAIITTQGDWNSFNFNFIKKLFKLKKIATYPNYRHGGAPQSLYIRNLENVKLEKDSLV